VYFASLAAGSEDAHTIQQVCARANVVVLKHPPATGPFNPGETMAVAAIARLIDRSGVIRARQVLETLRAAECARRRRGRHCVHAGWANIQQTLKSHP
jgi:hypothetical protein